MIWAAVLVPAAGVLPVLTARQAGQAGWLAPLAVLPAVLLLVKVLGELTAERGFADVLLDAPGKWTGRVLTIIYIMWALLLAAARVRLSARRLEFAAQQETGLALFLIVPVLAALWLIRGRVSAFVRTAAVFGRVLTVILTVLLILMLFQVRAENLLPLWFGDAVPVIKAALSGFGVLCVGVYGVFLKDGAEGERNVGWRVVGGCAVLGLLVLVVLGNMGTELTVALEDPFLTLSRQVGVKGAFQRAESLVAALWLLGDLAYLGMLLWACRRLMAAAFGGSLYRWGTPICAGLGLLGAETLLRDAALARRFEYAAAPWGNLILGAAVPCVLYLLARRKGISCAGNGGKKEDVGARKKG